MNGTTKRRLLLAALALLGIFAAGAALRAQSQAAPNALLDILGAPPRPLTPGAIHVKDLAADIKGFKGEILVRGVVARFAPKDPQLFAMVDAREARACKSHGCADFYLPVQVEGKLPREWDELDVRGTLVETGGMIYLRASQVTNFGSFK